MEAPRALYTRGGVVPELWLSKHLVRVQIPVSKVFGTKWCSAELGLYERRARASLPRSCIAAGSQPRSRAALASRFHSVSTTSQCSKRLHDTAHSNYVLRDVCGLGPGPRLSTWKSIGGRWGLGRQPRDVCTSGVSSALECQPLLRLSRSRSSSYC